MTNCHVVRRCSEMTNNYSLIVNTYNYFLQQVQMTHCIHMIWWQKRRSNVKKQFNDVNVV